VYCKPHFDQLFKVKGTYNIESNSGALKSYHDSSTADSANVVSKTNSEDMNDEDEVSLPDLKSIKSRFEGAAIEDSMVVIDREGAAGGAKGQANNSNGAVSSLKSQWATMANSSGQNTPQNGTANRSEEIQLCRSASQLRAQFDKQNLVSDSSAMDNNEVSKEELGQRERPETIAGGLASVKGMFEGGNRNSDQGYKNQAGNMDESLQAAMANRAISAKSMFESSNRGGGGGDDSPPKPTQMQEDESLMAARQGKSKAAVKSLFESNNSPRPEDTNGHSQNDELAAIRASRGTNLKAMFEGGGGNESKVQISKSYEDESLAAARANRGVANKSRFEGNQSENVVSKSESQHSDVQAGKARDLLSKFESGQISGDSNNNDKEKPGKISTGAIKVNAQSGDGGKSDVAASPVNSTEEDVNEITKDLITLLEYPENKKTIGSDNNENRSASNANTQSPPPVIISTVEDEPSSPIEPTAAG